MAAAHGSKSPAWLGSTLWEGQRQPELLWATPGRVVLATALDPGRSPGLTCLREEDTRDRGPGGPERLRLLSGGKGEGHGPPELIGWVNSVAT